MLYCTAILAQTKCQVKALTPCMNSVSVCFIYLYTESPLGTYRSQVQILSPRPLNSKDFFFTKLPGCRFGADSAALHLRRPKHACRGPSGPPWRRPAGPGRRRCTHADHGFMTSMPHSTKSSTLRVARIAPLERAIPAIMASSWLIGLPAAFRAAPISANISAAS